MVPAAPAAPEGQAAETQWLTELRRWLHLGRKGVIILIREARRARLRALVETLASIEPEFRFTADPAAIAGLERGSLVLFALREATLDWINLNRPLFAERSLRVVLWAEDELATTMKQLAPDLHDWVSHFVTCPPGVPNFAFAGLEQGLDWWPGVAWTGPGLDVAFARVSVDEVLELDPASDYSSLVEALEADRRRCVVWGGVQTVTGLWRLRWAIAEARHHGPNVLDNPEIGAPGFYRVHSELLTLAEVIAQFGDESLRRGGFVEFEAGALEFDPKADPSEALIERVGLLRESGPAMRWLHDSPEVKRWRKLRVAQMQARANDTRGWSRDEQALFGSLARDRKVWPGWLSPSWQYFVCEHVLRVSPGASESEFLVKRAAHMGHWDIVERWCERWGVAVPANASFDATMQWGDATAAPAISLSGSGHSTESAIAENAKLYIHNGESMGWELTLTWRGVALHALVMGDHASDQLPDFLSRVRDSARAQLGERDPHYLLILRILGLAAASFVDLALARFYLAQVSTISAPGDGAPERGEESLPLLVGAEIEWAVVMTMSGLFESGLPDILEEEPEDRVAFSRFHQLARAVLGRVTRREELEEIDESLMDGESIYDALQREGRQLLRERLMRLGNIVD